MIKLNGKEVFIKQFPNNESLISMPPLGPISTLGLVVETETVKVKFESDADLFHLYMVKKVIDDKGAKAELVIPYLPYSRMDRIERTSFCFTLKYLAKFINDLNFETVTILEPHSDVSVALLDRVIAIDKTLYLFEKFSEQHPDFDFESKNGDYVVFPDAGAEKRYSKQFEVSNTMSCIKHRDFATGNIKSLEVVGEKPKAPFKAVIVDDLCSRGGTFMLTANKLKELGATEIHLIVTHCENTIYEGDILKHDSPITAVHTTNSILDIKDQGFQNWHPELDLTKLHIEEVI